MSLALNFLIYSSFNINSTYLYRVKVGLNEFMCSECSKYYLAHRKYLINVSYYLFFKVGTIHHITSSVYLSSQKCGLKKQM